MSKSGFLKRGIEKKKIGKMIFSKVLEMPLDKYLNFIDKTTVMGLEEPFFTPANVKNFCYAKVMFSDGSLYFEVFDKRLEAIYSTQSYKENKIVCSLKWINTRNRFSLHILKSLLDSQSKYWFSGKNTDLKPLTLNEFLTLYPMQYLDQSRLSRLISNLSVINPQNQLINLQSLFISKKKYHAYLIKEIVEDDENTLKDKGIQQLLAQKGVRLSLRTICNCRKLLNIPNHREQSAYFYEKDISFSDYLLLSIPKYRDSKIPDEAGVYELSISPKIDYPNYRSNVIYIGCSKDLRKRVANYSGNKLKNRHLSRFISSYDVFVRFYLTGNYISVEKRLLKDFKYNYGELPKSNKVGG